MSPIKTINEATEGKDLQCMCDELCAHLRKFTRETYYAFYKEDILHNKLLEWWKEHVNTYLIFARIFKVHLAISATSAPSECIWIRASRILTMKYARLKDDVASATTLVRDNSRLLHKCCARLVQEEFSKKISWHD